MITTKQKLALLLLSCLGVTNLNAKTVQPPIMGWSSWNTYRVNISDSLIMRQADALVSTGLKDFGYNYRDVLKIN